MDPAQGETGGKSLTSKFKAHVPHTRVKDKVKNLKNRLPGMKKHPGDEEDSSEYDDNSPRGPGPETGYNVGESTPFTTAKTDSLPSPRGYESRPLGYDTQNRGYDTQNRGYDTQNLGYDTQNRGYDTQNRGYDTQNRGYDTQNRGYDTQNRGYDTQNRGYDTQDRGYDTQNRGYDTQNLGYVAAAPPPTRPAPVVTDSPMSNQVPSFEEKFKYLDVGEKSPRVVEPRSYQPETRTDPIRSYQPEKQDYSPSTTESMQKGYSDVSYRASPTTPTTPNKGLIDKVRESVAGAAVVLGDKVGYYNDTPAAPKDPNAPSILDKAKSTLGLNTPSDPNTPSMVQKTKATLGMDKPRDPNAPSVMEKTKAILGMDKPSDPNAPSLVEKTKATLGMDKPRDPNAPPLTEKAKVYAREYGATAADRAVWAKDRVAAHSTPTEHDKALSEQVTQTLSTLPGAIREKVFGPSSATSPSSPGVVDRVSGAVGSLFNSAPKETAERMQHTFPAHSDYPAAGGAVPPNFADRSSAEERMPPTSYAPPSYPTVTH